MMIEHIFPVSDIEAHFICIDCNTSTLSASGSSKAGHYYMVRHDVWHQATKEDERRGMLCLDCLAKRLGRPMRQSDFPAHIPINQRGYMAKYIGGLEP